MLEAWSKENTENSRKGLILVPKMLKIESIEALKMLLNTFLILIWRIFENSKKILMHKNPKFAE